MHFGGILFLSIQNILVRFTRNSDKITESTASVCVSTLGLICANLLLFNARQHVCETCELQTDKLGPEIPRTIGGLFFPKWAGCGAEGTLRRKLARIKV